MVLQVADDLRVGVEDVLSGVVRHRLVETALGVDGCDGDDARRLAGGHVVLAVGRRHMHDAGAVLGADELAGQHAKSVAHVIFVHEIRERRQIAHAKQVPAGVGAHDLGLFAELAGVSAQPRLREDVPPAIGRLHLNVFDRPD